MKFAFEGIGRGTGKKEHLSNAPEGTSASDQVRKRVSSRQAAGKMEKKERNGDEKRGKEGMQGMTRVCEVTGKCEEKQLNIPLWKNKCGRPQRIMYCTAIRGHLCSTSAVWVKGPVYMQVKMDNVAVRNGPIYIMQKIDFSRTRERGNGVKGILQRTNTQMQMQSRCNQLEAKTHKATERQSKLWQNKTNGFCSCHVNNTEGKTV